MRCVSDSTAFVEVGLMRQARRRCTAEVSVRSHGALMKYATDRLCADPEKAARRLMEHAQAFEPIQEGRIYIEKINGPFLFREKATPAEYKAGLDLAIERGWLVLHESGTFVRFTQGGADPFA